MSRKSEPEASDDEAGSGLHRAKSTDSKLYKIYVQGKVLRAELRQWFLIAVLALDGVDHKNRSPHPRMNLHTLVILLKSKEAKVSDPIFKEFKAAVQECLDIPGERYVLHSMCCTLPYVPLLNSLSEMSCKWSH